jgi:hypothetical protein
MLEWRRVCDGLVRFDNIGLMLRGAGEARSLYHLGGWADGQDMAGPFRSWVWVDYWSLKTDCAFLGVGLGWLLYCTRGKIKSIC